MDQTMQDAMKLQNDSEVPLQIQGQGGEVMEVSPEAVAAEGMSYSAGYMAGNGPILPLHIGKPKTMTKSQLEEQKMREAEGYPSNLDEAQKVQELEAKVTSMESGINAILNHLGANQKFTPPSVAQSPLVETPSPGPTGQSQRFPGGPMEPPSIPTSEPPSPSPTVSPESNVRVVTLKDGRKIQVPRMGLGKSPQTESPEIPEPVENMKDDWGSIVEPPVVETEEPKNDPRAERIQHLVTEIFEFMKAGDCHRFWRRHVAGVHRHVGYNGWSKSLKDEFDKRFEGFLNDGSFVTNIATKIVDMEFGNALGGKWATSMVVATAGFTAFALSGLDG